MVSRCTVLLYVITSTFIAISAQSQGTNELDAVMEVSRSLNTFALNLLTETSRQAGGELNLAVSPLTVWSLLTIIAEGARGNTAKQLEYALKIPPVNNRDAFRKNYKSLTKYLTQSDAGVLMDISNSIFTTKDQSLNRTYQGLAKMFYGVDIMPVDFSNLVECAKLINSHIASATKNRIRNFVSIDDLIDAEILLTSTLYFKGRWTKPFAENETFSDTFYDESGKPTGKVQMMYQESSFPFTLLNGMSAHAIELPYGKGDRMSMIVILPRKGEKLSNVLEHLTQMPFERILQALDQSKEQYSDEDIKVYLPRFVIESDFILNAVLDKLGVKDVFNQNTADLLGIFPNYLYVTRLIQQAKIVVNEEGSEASSVAGAAFAYKSPSPKFYANKPFAYFIVDRQVNSIVFEGTVSNPSTICDTCTKKHE